MPKYHINLFFSADDGCWVADVPDLRFCSAFGDTAEEALREVQGHDELAEGRQGASRTDPQAEVSPGHLSDRVIRHTKGLHRNGVALPLVN